MIDKLILRAIEESFELRFLLSSNSEIDQSSRKYFEDNGFKLYFYSSVPRSDRQKHKQTDKRDLFHRFIAILYIVIYNRDTVWYGYSYV